MIRLILRTLVFFVITLFVASLLSTLLFVLVAFVFDASGDTFFDIYAEFGDGWPAFAGSLLFAGVIVWRFFPIRRKARI